MTERRQLSIKSQQDIVREVETLAQGNVTTLGNHSFSEIVYHLALTNDMVTGKLNPPKLPLLMRLMMPLLKGSILKNPVKPGFKLPTKMEKFFWPDTEVELSEAIKRLKDSVERYETNGPLLIHPVFGKATRQQVDTVTFSHAAMHLSHVLPSKTS